MGRSSLKLRPNWPTRGLSADHGHDIVLVLDPGVDIDKVTVTYTATAGQAVADLRDWPGERFGHRWLLERAWRLRDSIRGWDAFYVALAEAFDATLLTLDGRLALAHGPTCRIEVLGGRD
ncbi:MAG: putative nucleic acid-binding protein contains domain [Mycobacterium sp.]|nr:putative nucleic acid-binding protein contains domain [Mycobacterium sp.]